MKNRVKKFVKDHPELTTAVVLSSMSLIYVRFAVVGAEIKWIDVWKYDEGKPQITVTFVNGSTELFTNIDE